MLRAEPATRPEPGRAEWGPSAPDPGPIVEVRGLSKRFPVRRSWKETVLHPRSTEYQEALVDVDLHVRRGEFFGLLGRNGAGKTTLFKILATLVLADEGEARVRGLDVARAPEAVRRTLVPVLPYERSLYWRLTARENLRLYAALHGYRGRDREARVDRTLETVGLQDTGTKQVGLFSSGMRHRLMVARALLSDPEVLLLDEPTRSLDPVSARDLRRFLRHEINERQGCTVLLATHNADEVRELCHRVGILEEGSLVLAGDTDELLHAVGEHSYRIVSRAPIRGLLPELRARGLITRVTDGRELAEGWHESLVEIPGGRPACAALLRTLLDRKVEVASLEPRDVPLAELIETVVSAAGRQEDGSRRKGRPGEEPR
jgi:ABC-2 type transport system ATP-binding protein